MSFIGFRKLRDRWKPTGKMAYWLFVKHDEPPMMSLNEPLSQNLFGKKAILRTGNRNNFCILISSLFTFHK